MDWIDEAVADVVRNLSEARLDWAKNHLHYGNNDHGAKVLTEIAAIIRAHSPKPDFDAAIETVETKHREWLDLSGHTAYTKRDAANEIIAALEAAKEGK